MFHEFSNLLRVDTPLGRGHALFIEGADHTYYWTVALGDTRALVTFTQPQIRVVRNYSYGWGMSHKDMQEVLK